MVKEIIRKSINDAISPWLVSMGMEEMPMYTIEEPPAQFKADLSVNIAMVVAKKLRKNPLEIAQQITACIEQHNDTYIFGNLTVEKPGFINIMLGNNVLYDAVRNAGTLTDLGHAMVKPKVLIEFVSANPTGPLHIGHGRGAALGDSLSRIMRLLGYQVDTEYYVNDAGNQMETLGQSVMARADELKGKKTKLPEDGYQGDYIIDIAKSLLKENKNYDFKIAQKYAIDSILAMIKKDCDRFKVNFNTWFYESQLFEQEAVEKTMNDLIAKHHVFAQDGAFWFKSTAWGDEKDRVVKRADNRYTYLASDIAYHAEKIKRGYDMLIDIWGADHHGYVKRLKASLSALGYKEDCLNIILYQLVTLMRGNKPVAMSTRAGQFVTLQEVLDEVGVDACRFFFAMRSPQSQLEFDLELAKKQSNENPVFYVQYVHARICSIFREAEKQRVEPIAYIDWHILSSVEERNLMIKLAFFADTLLLCVNEQTPHHLTRYLMELAGMFHKFYDTCRVITPDSSLTASRLMLIDAVKKTIALGLSLLGVSAPDKM